MFTQKKILLTLALILSTTLLVQYVGVNALTHAGEEPKWLIYTSLDGGVTNLAPLVAFTVTPSGMHIVSDGLYAPGTVALPGVFNYQGWVTYNCATDGPEPLANGFKYTIEIRAQSPNTKYDVVAVALPFILDDNNNQIPTSDYPHTPYTLGTIHTNANGDGSISRLLQLPTGLYGWEIQVKLGSTIVLSSALNDSIDFITK